MDDLSFSGWLTCQVKNLDRLFFLC
jgi:hypothetical protein